MSTSTTMDTSMIESRGKVRLNPNNTLSSDFEDFILDETWAKRSFLIDDISLSNSTDRKNRYWSSASAKFTDTRMGGNIGINARPQFTRYSDIRTAGRVSGRAKVTLTQTTGNHGMGRYYSEAIDDPAQTIYMRFGVPQFNSLTTFLARAFDPDQTALARTGRAPGIFYNAAKLVGTITTAIAFPLFTAFVFTGRAINWLFSRPTSKFYVLKPTMHTYWSAVNHLVNNFAINRGLLPKVLSEDSEGQRLGTPYKLDRDQLKFLSDLLPDVFRDDTGYIDVYAVANKAQRVANKIFKAEYDAVNNATATDFEGYLKRNVTGEQAKVTYVTADNTLGKFEKYIERVINFSYWFGGDAVAEGKARSETDPRVPEKPEDPKAPGNQSAMQQFFTFFDAEFSDGSQFAIFRVDHTGAAQESFGNSAQESDLSRKINDISSSARQARFTFADGNIVGGTIEQAIQGVMGAAKDVVMGGLDGLTLGFSNALLGLTGSGYVDIPKHWQSSTATLSRTTYTIQLISPYGNVISQLQNIYVPFFMLLAGALPLSTGKQSYTSPFLCQIFDRGRNQIKLGMIESLSISRGTSNLAFNTKGNALAIDVSFTVMDLSSIMHMPISGGSLFGNDMALDDDNILQDYLAVLAGQDLYTQIYEIPKAKLRIAKLITSGKKLTSPAYWAGMIHESMKSGVIDDLTLGASGVLVNVIEGAARGADVAQGPTR